VSTGSRRRDGPEADGTVSIGMSSAAVPGSTTPLGVARFEFVTAHRIIFGTGTLVEAAPIARGMGRRALVVTGRTTARAEPLLADLHRQRTHAVVFAVRGEPTIESVREGTALASAEGCDHVIGFGGGAALDAAKAIAAMLTNEGDVLDYLEIIGGGRALLVATVPLIAIPTTAGTGSEVTRNAVLASPEHRIKVSLRSLLMVPAVALIDPELTCSVPPALTATTGLDALTQLVEPFVCARTNPLVDALCLEGIRRAARSLPMAFENGRDLPAREDMAAASLFGGIALANAGLGAVHGIAGPLGGMFPIPHGAACAALLPHVVAANVRALRDRAPRSEALGRYETVARLLTGNPQAAAEDSVAWLTALNDRFDIRGLSGYGIGNANFAVITEKAAEASSMKANPIALTPEELTRVLQSAL